MSVNRVELGSLQEWRTHRDEPVCARLLTSVTVRAVGRASKAAICRVTYYDLEEIWYMETTLTSTNLGTAELTQAALGRHDGSGQEHAVPVEAADGTRYVERGDEGRA